MGVPQQQKASFFALRNDDWCILGLDTGYNSVQWPLVEYVVSPDAALPPAIVSWLQSIAPSLDNRGLILLTHHQVLSAYDSCFTRQADQIATILKRPVLWFWGHEHRLVLYKTYDGAARQWPVITGRCIGHGGMPVDLPGQHKSGLIGEADFIDRRLYKNDEKLRVGINGFAQLTLRGKALQVDYIDIHGQTVFEESFSAEGGAVRQTAFTNHLLDKPTASSSVA